MDALHHQACFHAHSCVHGDEIHPVLPVREAPARETKQKGRWQLLYHCMVASCGESGRKIYILVIVRLCFYKSTGRSGELT